MKLPRPRDRTTMNYDPEFKRLRAAVTQYLMEVGVKQGIVEDSRVLPKVAPVNFAGPPPKAYRDAAAIFVGSALRRVHLSARPIRRPMARSPSSRASNFLKMHKGEFVSLIGHSGCGS